jgi:uncharacterized repeat protein (TIGR02543 family)
MDAAKNITANFTSGSSSYNLTTEASVGGSISTGGNYNAGEVVTVTATANTGYTFSGWSGDVSGTTNPVTVTMSADKSIMANFSIIPSVGLGLLSHWNFDESSGSRVGDATANDNEGTLTGSLRSVTGQGGSAFHLAGDYVTSNTSYNLDHFTVNLWFKRQGASSGGEYHTLISGLGHVLTAADGSIILSSDGKQMSYSMRTGTNNVTTGVNSAVSFDDNDWHMVTATRDSGHLYLYIDGILKGSRVSSPTGVAQRANTPRIGAWRSVSSLYNANGVFDLFRLYDKALTASEIAAIYVAESVLAP